MYSGGDTEKQNALFAAMGAPPEMFDGLRQSTEVEIFPCNWKTIECFIDLQTQWRTGMSGATGLDYTAVSMVLDLREILKPKKRREVFDGIRVMESAALELWAEQREE